MNKAHELAEKIKQMQETWNMGMSWSQKGGLWGEVESLLSSALEEAVLEAFDNKFKNEHKRCLELARAAALEEAAKIAENFWAHVPQEEYDRGFEPDHLTPKEIARQIRRFAEKEKSE